MSKREITDEKFVQLTKDFDVIAPAMVSEDMKTVIMDKVFNPLMIEMQHKIKLSGILTLISDRIRNQEVRLKRTTEELDVAKNDGDKKRYKERLKSIEFKLTGLRSKAELITHLMDSTLNETSDGSARCVCCNKIFKYKTA